MSAGDVVSFAERKSKKSSFHPWCLLEWLDEITFKLFLIKQYHYILYRGKFTKLHTPLPPLCAFIQSIFKKSAGPKSFEISKNEIDESQIIYNYLENSHSDYLVISDRWLEKENIMYLEKELTNWIF